MVTQSGKSGDAKPVPAKAESTRASTTRTDSQASAPTKPEVSKQDVDRSETHTHTETTVVETGAVTSPPVGTSTPDPVPGSEGPRSQHEIDHQQ